MRALARRVGSNAVNSHRCEDQREQPECAHECSGDALTDAGDLLAQFERGHIEHYQFGIQVMDGLLDRLAERQRIACHANSDNHVRPVKLIERQIHEWRRLLV